jgi:membrane associated rhomboid family serine protease
MAFAEVYRSHRLHDVEQRAFLLYVVGIRAEIAPIGGEFALFVAEEERDAALSELRRHEAEARAAAAPPPAPLNVHAYAWVGSATYALVLIVVAWCAGESLFGVDWREAGALRPVAGGEWPRLVTALTLHGDVAHLLSNLAFGAFFGYFAGQLLGPGVAWFSILLGGVLGNLLDALLMPPSGASIGASTAVFATLGLVAALSWRLRANVRMRWAHRWAPLIAGVALLAFTGAGGENTDVIAHVTGFLSGAALGAALGSRPLATLHAPGVQRLAALAGVAAIAGAWSAQLA